MNVNATNEQLNATTPLDKLLCPQQSMTTGTYTYVRTSPYIPEACLRAPVSDLSIAADYFSIVNGFSSTCTADRYPLTTDGVGVTFSERSPPLRIALDQKSSFNANKKFSQSGDGVDTDCAATLNGTTFCPSANGCTWQSFVVGKDQGINCRTVDNYADPRCNCSGMNSYCQSTMSLCFKTRADPSFLRPCCLGIWPTTESHSIQVPVGIAKDPTLPILTLTAPGQTELPDPLTVSNTMAINPFQMACDPTWCAGSPACDPILYDTCAWSVTVVNGTTRSALLAPSGMCNVWYKSYVSQGLVGPNSFAIMDSIVNEYCIKSATALGDTTSCACVDPSSQDIFYRWYSTDSGFSSKTYEVTAVNMTNQDSIAVSDHICSNPFCIEGFQYETSFITSGLLARKTTCPTQTCMQVQLGLVVSATSIAAGGYVNIGNTSLLCTGAPTVADDVPLLELFPLNEVWFYNGINGEYINPDNQAQFLFRNVSSVPTYVDVTFGGLPNWLTPVTLINYPIQTYSNNVFVLEFHADRAPGPIALTVNVTVTAVTDKYSTPYTPPAVWSAPMNLNIVDISMPVPLQPPPSKPATDENGFPLTLNNQLSIGAIAMVVLSACLILFSLFLVVNNLINANASR